jgi:D-alanyl-D-alanine carboxypeptidase/D-alanyl-D-alanine-endopeptidase (penicillin-binding protein 4)
MHRVLVAWCLSLCASLAHAQLPSPVSEALGKAGVPQEAVAVLVQSVNKQDGAPIRLVDHRADQAMNPASTMKVLTTYAGLELLGPAYRWPTEIFRTGEVGQGILNGDLVIKGYGDPSLMAQDLWMMLTRLRQTGIRDIRGDLVLDSSYFASNAQSAGAFDNEPYRAYNATPSALVSNLKSTSFRFSSDAQRLAIQADPELPAIKIVNQVKWSPGACGDWKGRLSYVVANEADRATVTFSGSYAGACGEKVLELSVMNESAYTFELFRTLWKQLGGTLVGGLRLEATPVTATKLFQHDSAMLSDVIRPINKYSNNLMARQLFLTIAAQNVAIPGKEPDGEKAIKSWLASKGLSFPELVLENGSGLSRIERISAGHMGDLLQQAYDSPVMPELMSSLPVLAVDGTTRKRLNGSAAQGRAHLKTGSLEGVRAIAGYLLDQYNRRWIVVFMVNHNNAGATKAAQDALVDWIYHQP